MKVNNDWRTTVIGILAAILITGAGSWFAFGSGTLSEAEAGQIKSELNTSIERLAVIVKENSDAVSALTALQAGLTERVGNLVDRLDREMDRSQP